MAGELGTATLDTAVDLTGLAKGLEEGERQAAAGSGRMGDALKGALGVAASGAGVAAAAGVVALGAALFDASEQAGAIKTALGEIGDESIQAIADGAGLLKARYGVELPEVLTGVRSLMDNFGMSAEDALDFVTRGFEENLNASGDFIDSIGEYATQFANGGADAGEFFSILETGAQAGILGTDKAADAFKEFRLRILDGSDSTAAALAQLGLNTDQILTGLSDGSLSAVDAFGMVTEALAATEDPALRMQAGAALIGSQFEDLGDSVVANLSTTTTSLDDLAGSTEAAADRVGSLGEIGPRLMAEFSASLVPVAERLLPIVQEHMPTFSRFLELLTSVGVPLLIGGLELLNVVLTGLSALMSGDLSAAMRGFHALFLPLQLGAGSLRESLFRFGSSVRDLFSGIGESIQERFERLIDWIFGLPGRMAEAGRNFIFGLIRGVGEAWGQFWEDTRQRVFGWIDAFNGWLGNRSPSAKARAAMLNFYRGADLGAAAMEPVLLARGQRMADAMLGPLGSLDASRTDNRSVSMTVYSQAPTSTVVSDLSLATAAIGGGV